MASAGTRSIHWFRKGLRLHDNPSLLEACKHSTQLYPIFIIDPWFANPEIVGVNRYAFLLESLQDLDDSLKSMGSRLFVIKGKPEEVLPSLIKDWDINLLTFESDTEPYAVARDSNITKILQEQTKGKIKIFTFASHTIFNTHQYIAASKNKLVKTYQSFGQLFASLGPPRQPFPVITKDMIPPISVLSEYNSDIHHVPTLKEMGYNEIPTNNIFKGGEKEALERLQHTVISKPLWTIAFEKPNTSPNSLEPSTTVLSPYLKFGCLSATTFYHALNSILKEHPKHTLPPVSLHGQLLWREFFYYSAVAIPNFDKMKGNPECKQIPWDKDEEKIAAFKHGRTGYPYIDAIMIQLKQIGWIHHLARHSVACFLTRGDLWQSWEEGVKIFDLYLLDSDYSLNNANWQWLSCSNFFFQYFRCYSPVAFGKKTDPDGLFIKKWIPQLKNMPSKYIYEPWKAPIHIQREAGCIVGKDYPFPIVDHDIVSKENMNKMKLAYDSSKSNVDFGRDGDDTDIPMKKKMKK